MASPAQPTYGFIINVVDDGRAQLESCLGFLRAAHPDAPVRVISDGCADPSYPEVCRRHGATYVPGKHLKRIECGGAWWRRTLEEGLVTGARWLVKLDPDTRVWRPAAEPAHPIAGTLDHKGTDRENVLGGFQAIHESAARHVLACGILDDPALKDHRTFGGTEAEYRHWVASAFMGSDMSLAWIARNLGIACGDWPEAGVRWTGEAPDNGDRRYAATHPHRLEPGPRFPAAGLTVISTCKGRLRYLRESLPTWLEAGVDVVVVDYGCPEGTADWVRANHPEVTVVRATGPGTEKFHLARARNLGAAAAGPGWWCFWDADLVCSPGWADAVRRSLRHRTYLNVRPIAWDQFGSAVVHSADYRAAGGYDETYRGWGAEDGDFYDRLRTLGIRHGWFPGACFRTAPNTEAERAAHYDDKVRGGLFRYYSDYHLAKKRWMVEHGRVPSAAESRRLFDGVVAAVNAETGRELVLPTDLLPVAVEVTPGGTPDAGPGSGSPARPEGAACAGPLPPSHAIRAVPGFPGAVALPDGQVVVNGGGVAVGPVDPATGAASTVLMPPGGGPKLTFSVHFGDARAEASADIGHLIEQGRAAGARADRPVVASEHVAR